MSKSKPRTIFIVKQQGEGDIDSTYAFSDEKKCDEFESRLEKVYEIFQTWSFSLIVDDPDAWNELEQAEADKRAEEEEENEQQ